MKFGQSNDLESVGFKFPLSFKSRALWTDPRPSLQPRPPATASNIPSKNNNDHEKQHRPKARTSRVERVSSGCPPQHQPPPAKRWQTHKSQDTKKTTQLTRRTQTTQTKKTTRLSENTTCYLFPLSGEKHLPPPPHQDGKKPEGMGHGRYETRIRSAAAGAEIGPLRARGPPSSEGLRGGHCESLCNERAFVFFLFVGVPFERNGCFTFCFVFGGVGPLKLKKREGRFHEFLFLRSDCLLGFLFQITCFSPNANVHTQRMLTASQQDMAPA